MNERDIKTRLGKIKASILESVKLKKEADKKRDDLFSSILSDLDQEYDRLIALVRTAKYELIFEDMLSSNRNKPDQSDESFHA